jgi:hypothetical protein
MTEPIARAVKERMNDDANPRNLVASFGLVSQDKSKTRKTKTVLQMTEPVARTVTDITDEMIERTARAICANYGADPDELVRGKTIPRWKVWANDARTALEAALRQPDPVARTIKDFCRAYGIGKTMAYELMGAGKLAAVKVGARTLITEESARAWFNALSRTHNRTHAVPTDTGGTKRKLAEGIKRKQ